MTINAILIYGATGFTGGLIARAAKKLPCRMALAGRDRQPLERLAQSLDVEMRCFALDDFSSVLRAVRDIDIVLNAAGPFLQTCAPILAACLATGAHYLDITGELPVFAEVRRHDAIARERGVMLMPGVGFMIVASDCLAADVAALVPGAKYLRFGVARPKMLSRGSLRTVFCEPRGHVMVRRGGRLTLTPVGRLERDFDYGEGDQPSMAFSLADVFTAYLTTGIPNIEAYLEFILPARFLAPLGVRLLDAVRTTPARPWLDAGCKAWPKSLVERSASGDRRRSGGQMAENQAYSANNARWIQFYRRHRDGDPGKNHCR